MEKSGVGCGCFTLLVLLSLMSHVTELVLTSVLAHSLYRDPSLRDVFFSLTAGFLILPLVLVQLLSALLVLRQRGDSMTGGQAAMTGLLHLLQLAFLWRHVTLLRKHVTLLAKNQVWELFLLRMIFTLAGGFPLLLMELYLLFRQEDLALPWILYATILSAALSSTCSVASFRPAWSECREDWDSAWGLSWPGSLFTGLWRLGETVSRMMCLGLFTALYGQWVLLLLGLHCLVMLLCITLPQTASGQVPGSSSAQRVAFCLLTAYCYVWCYVSLGPVRSAVWYTLFYIIMFLENCTLSIVWLTKSDHDTFSPKYLLVAISTLAFLLSIVCLLVYHKLFHHLTITTTTASTLEGSKGTCLHVCPHSASNRHPPPPAPQPPYPSLQYQTAVTSGQYYKHAVNDSLMDSASDLTSLSGCRQQVRSGGGGCRHVQVGREMGGCVCRGEGDGVSVGSGHTCRSSSSCPHRHCLRTSRSDVTDTTSVLTLTSGASLNLGYEGSDDTQSNTMPAWLPSGDSLIARHLLAPHMAPHMATGPEGGLNRALHYHWARRQRQSRERYRYVLRQEVRKLGREAMDGAQCQHSGADWSALPAVLDMTHLDTDRNTCPHLPPTDTQVSSILRGADRSCRPHEDSDGDGGGGGDNVHDVLNHGHTQRSPTQASGPLTSCPCCRQPGQLHSQPDVSTIWQHKDSCTLQSRQQYSSTPCVSVCEGQSGKRARSALHGYHNKLRSRSADSKLRSHSADSKLRSHSADSKLRSHSADRRQRSAAHRGQHSDNDPSRHPLPASEDHPANMTSPRHVPSKLQVKAIAAKSQEDSGGCTIPASTSEPIYENVSVCVSAQSGPGTGLTTISCRSHEASLHLTSTKDTNETVASERHSDTDNSLTLKTPVDADINSQTLRTPVDTDNNGLLVKPHTNKDGGTSDKTLKDVKAVNRQKTRSQRQEDRDLSDARPHNGSHPHGDRDLSKIRPHKGSHPYEDRGLSKIRLHNGPQLKWTGARRAEKGRCAVRQEAWYMCSESEDSALPTDTFSSSVEDAFTATDLDSEGSLEFII